MGTGRLAIAPMAFSLCPRSAGNSFTGGFILAYSLADGRRSSAKFITANAIGYNASRINCFTGVSRSLANFCSRNLVFAIVSSIGSNKVDILAPTEVVGYSRSSIRKHYDTTVSKRFTRRCNIQNTISPIYVKTSFTRVG